MVDKSFTSSLIGATEDVLFIGPDGNTEGPGSPDLLIYVLPGNPCLISFYESFMSHLSELLNHKKRKVVVCGSTLPGFQPAQPTTLHGTLPVGLENQILNAEELAIRAITRCTSTRGIGGAGPDTQVVLVAHSVGAYMALEILRRRAQGLNRLAEFNVMGAVLLFPTIVEIAKSQHGIILSRFLRIPKFPALVATIARMLICLIPLPVLSWLTSLLGRGSPHMGKATATFLKSPMGVYQALYMTIDEMSMITRDAWDEAIWVSRQADSKGANQAVPLRLYFGEQDIWVNNEARDRLIATRARQENEDPGLGKPVMLIDNEHIPHGFVVGHSERIAEKTRLMIEDLIDNDRLRSRTV